MKHDIQTAPTYGYAPQTDDGTMLDPHDCTNIGAAEGRVLLFTRSALE